MVVIVDYKPDIDYKPEGSDPVNEPDTQEKEENSNTEYARIEILQQGTLHKRSMNSKVTERIKWIHWLGGPEMMALWLHDMYLWLKLSPEAANFLVKEQELDSLEGLQVLTDKNVDDICNVVRKPGARMPVKCPTGATGFS